MLTLYVVGSKLITPGCLANSSNKNLAVGWKVLGRALIDDGASLAPAAGTAALALTAAVVGGAFLESILSAKREKSLIRSLI